MTGFDLARVAPEKAVLRPALPVSSLPGVIGTHMTTMSYRDQLLHPNWQRKRLECLDAAGWKCVRCQATESTLHVHHKRYVKGRMAWEYEDHELAVLCANCHQSAHGLQDEIAGILTFADISLTPKAENMPSVCSVLLGYLWSEVSEETRQRLASVEQSKSYRAGIAARLLVESDLSADEIGALGTALIDNLPKVRALFASSTGGAESA